LSLVVLGVDGCGARWFGSRRALFLAGIECRVGQFRR